MNLKSTLLIATLFLFGANAMAQDYIYKKNREILTVKLLEVGEDEIKYKDHDNPDGPTFTIDKAKVKKLELENGDEIKMETTDSFEDPDYYTDQNENLIKWSFTSILFNHLDFYYERSMTPSQSFEAGIGIIGVGYSGANDEWSQDTKRNPAGVALRAGYKFKRSPDYYLPKMRYGHILKGSYIKPELIMTFYSEDVKYRDHTSPGNGYVAERHNATSGALMINFGKQWIFSDKFALDMYFGIGYGFSTSLNNELDNDLDYFVPTTSPVQYSYMLAPGSFPLAGTGGIRIGYLF